MTPQKLCRVVGQISRTIPHRSTSLFTSSSSLARNSSLLTRNHQNKHHNISQHHNLLTIQRSLFGYSSNQPMITSQHVVRGLKLFGYNTRNHSSSYYYNKHSKSQHSNTSSGKRCLLTGSNKTARTRYMSTNQHNMNYQQRSKLLETLSPMSRVISRDVINTTGHCTSCHQYFYHTLHPETFRRFILHQLDRREHRERGYGFMKTLPVSGIREQLNKQLLVIEKLVRVIPHAHQIVGVVDKANLLNGGWEELAWCQENRGKVVVVSEFFAPHQFTISTFDSVSKKTYSVKCRYFFKGLDDLYCLYLSLLLPHMPRVITRDQFKSERARAREFERETGAWEFGSGVERMLSNLCCSGVPESQRNGFYSQCGNIHHLIEGNVSYCVQTENT